jgi:hypothetical protein
VDLVAHVQRLGDDVLEVDLPQFGDSLLQDGIESPFHPSQPLGDRLAIGAVAQHLAQPLVHRAVGEVAVRLVHCSTNTGIEGETMPAIGPTACMLVTGGEA